MNQSSRSLTYHTISGKTVDLSTLTPAERENLKGAIELLWKQLPWEKFVSTWRRLFKKSRISRHSLAFRVCEDLEVRLGVKQGKLDAPDYRYFIVQTVAERFPSFNKLCDEAGIDRGHLSRVLQGESDLAIEALKKVFDALGLVLWARPKEEVRAESEKWGDELAAISNAIGREP